MRIHRSVGACVSCAFAALGLLLVLACEPRAARITDLQTGRSLDVEMPWLNKGGGGQIAGTASDGERFTGNFAAVPGEPSGTDLLLRVASAVAFDQGHIQLAQNLDGIQNREEYTATLTGDRGTVLDLVFAVNTRTGHGTGSGKDNRGGTYRIQL